MLDKSNVEFKGDHFIIDGETRVNILTQAKLDKMEKKHEFMKERNYNILGYMIIENKQYVFVTFGTSGEIVTLPPREVKQVDDSKKT